MISSKTTALRNSSIQCYIHKRCERCYEAVKRD